MGENNPRPAFFYCDYIYKQLEVALDIGIKEAEFWSMTLAELGRAIDSHNRTEKRRAQERASYDYILAELIGRSVSRIYSSSAKMPDISEVYPTIFDSKEIQEQKQNKINELSVARFRQFADSFNANYKGGQKGQ